MKIKKEEEVIVEEVAEKPERRELHVTRKGLRVVKQ